MGGCHEQPDGPAEAERSSTMQASFLPPARTPQLSLNIASVMPTGKRVPPLSSFVETPQLIFRACPPEEAPAVPSEAHSNGALVEAVAACHGSTHAEAAEIPCRLSLASV